jgi:hypothetical protein
MLFNIDIRIVVPVARVHNNSYIYLIYRFFIVISAFTHTGIFLIHPFTYKEAFFKVSIFFIVEQYDE